MGDFDSLQPKVSKVVKGGKMKEVIEKTEQALDKFNLDVAEFRLKKGDSMKLREIVWRIMLLTECLCKTKESIKDFEKLKEE